VFAAARLIRDEDPTAIAALSRALFFSHRSTEPGHRLAMAACAGMLGIDERPFVELEMRLGEGTGAALAMPLLRASAAVMRNMATFESAGVSGASNG
jgi:nicotinate-nucleotide--dimethylbenzimidazole phosphoribosyltransferase